MPDPDRMLTPAAVDRIEARLRAATAVLPLRRRRRRAMTAAVPAALLATLALLAAPIGDRGAGEALAGTVALPNGETVALEGAPAASHLGRVARSLEAAGLTLKVRPVAVADDAVGRVLGIEYPAGVEVDDERAIVPRGLVGDVVVTIGRSAVAGEDAGTNGLTIFEANPQLCQLVDPYHAASTARRLRAAGYRVSVAVAEFPAPVNGIVHGPALERPVSEPPQGSVVLTVSDGDFGVSKLTRDVHLEVADAKTLPDSEPIGQDASC